MPLLTCSPLTVYFADNILSRNEKIELLVKKTQTMNALSIEIKQTVNIFDLKHPSESGVNI